MKVTLRARRGLHARALALALLAALGATARAQTGPTPSIASTSRELQKLDGGAIYDSKISPEVSALIKRLKHGLRDLVARTLDADASPHAPARTLNARVLAALKREGVRVGPPPDDVHTFGSVVSVNVVRPSGHADLVAVTTTVSVHCGADNSLYLFRREGSRMRLALAYESDEYEQVSGARERFDFRVSPADARGGFFVVAADVNPWCTSNWQMLRYAVMRVGEDAYAPRVVLRGEEGIYLGTELEGFRLDATARTFTLRFDASQSLDSGILVRAHVLKFEVDGDKASRVAPVAFKPEDFADEWAQMKWDEAARWSEPSRLDELKGGHARLNAKGEGFHGSEFLFVRPCGRPAREWQIGVEGFTGDGGVQLPRRFYFTVARVGAAFLMRSVGDSPPPACRGKS